MKTSLEECSKCAPRGRGGEQIIPDRERKQGQDPPCPRTRPPAPSVRIAKVPSRTVRASREDSGSSLGYPPCSVAVRAGGSCCLLCSLRVLLAGTPGAALRGRAGPAGCCLWKPRSDRRVHTSPRARGAAPAGSMSCRRGCRQRAAALPAGRRVRCRERTSRPRVQE